MYSKQIQLVRGIGAETKITQKRARNATPPRNDPFLPTQKHQPKKKRFLVLDPFISGFLLGISSNMFGEGIVKTTSVRINPGLGNR